MFVPHSLILLTV